MGYNSGMLSDLLRSTVSQVMCAATGNNLVCRCYRYRRQLKSGRLPALFCLPRPLGPARAPAFCSACGPALRGRFSELGKYGLVRLMISCPCDHWQHQSLVMCSSGQLAVGAAPTVDHLLTGGLVHPFSPSWLRLLKLTVQPASRRRAPSTDSVMTVSAKTARWAHLLREHRTTAGRVWQRAPGMPCACTYRPMAE